MVVAHRLSHRFSRSPPDKLGAACPEIVRRHRLSIFMWPEGTRSRDGRLLPFKKGIVHMALQTGLPVVPVVVNVRAEAVTEPDRIRDLLVAQVTGAVRWRESVLWMESAGVTEFWEIGAGKALSGMIKRIAKEAVTRAVGTPDDVLAAKG